MTPSRSPMPLNVASSPEHLERIGIERLTLKGADYDRLGEPLADSRRLGVVEVSAATARADQLQEAHELDTVRPPVGVPREESSLVRPAGHYERA